LASDNRRTIEIIATGKVRLVADSAEVKLGFTNALDSKDAAYVEGVDWGVADPQALQEKAYAAALTRAKEIAERVAAQAGVKLGELLTIINGEQSEGFAKMARPRAIAPPPPPPPPKENLQLYPGKIEREETVTVIYGIAQ
jgi:uncharacterized protein YggE